MPTVLIGDNTGDDFATVDSCRLVMEAGSDDTNFDGTYFEIAKWSSGSDEIDSWVRATGLSNITGPVTVSPASFSFYRTAGNASYTINGYQCLRNAVESQATWNDYATASAWSSGGGRGSGTDRSSTTICTMSVTNSNGYKTSTDCSAIVEDWINGDASNYGTLWERSGTGNSQYARFNYSGGTDGQRPYLTLTYTEGGGGGGGTILPYIMNYYYGG